MQGKDHIIHSIITASSTSLFLLKETTLKMGGERTMKEGGKGKVCVITYKIASHGFNNIIQGDLIYN